MGGGVNPFFALQIASFILFFFFFSFLFFFFFSFFSFLPSVCFTMGSLKNKRKKISKLQRSLLMKSNLSKAKSTRGKHEFFIPAVRGSLAAPQQGETITVYAHYHERGVVAPFRGSSSKGSSKDPANLARAVALNLSLLQHATQTPFEAMAASSRIKQVTKSVIELKKAAKTKLKQVKARYEGMVDKRREVNTTLLRDAIGKATFNHGLSLGASTQVRMLSLGKSHVAHFSSLSS